MNAVIGVFNGVVCAMILFAAWAMSAPPFALFGIAIYLAVAWLLIRLIWVNATPGYFGFGTVLLITLTGMIWPFYAPSALEGVRSGRLVWRRGS